MKCRRAQKTVPEWPVLGRGKERKTFGLKDVTPVVSVRAANKGVIGYGEWKSL
jgi:hypothetical protein